MHQTKLQIILATEQYVEAKEKQLFYFNERDWVYSTLYGNLTQSDTNGRTPIFSTAESCEALDYLVQYVKRDAERVMPAPEIDTEFAELYPLTAPFKYDDGFTGAMKVEQGKKPRPEIPLEKPDLSFINRVLSHEDVDGRTMF